MNIYLFILSAIRVPPLCTNTSHTPWHSFPISASHFWTVFLPKKTKKRTGQKLQLCADNTNSNDDNSSLDCVINFHSFLIVDRDDLHFFSNYYYYNSSTKKTNPIIFRPVLSVIRFNDKQIKYLTNITVRHLASKFRKKTHFQE